MHSELEGKMALNDLVAKGAALSDLRAFPMEHNDFGAMWVMFSDLRGCMLNDFAGSRANEAFPQKYD